MSKEKRVAAEHGVVCSLPNERLGYFGWPTIARTDSGRLVVGVSGLRYEHMCPWGKTVLFTSEDEGKTWSWPRVVNNTPLDDRDCGVLSLGGEKLLITWITSDTRWHFYPERLSEEEAKIRKAVYDAVPDEVYSKWRGSWLRISEDGDAWSDYIRMPVNTPHGPIRLASGDLLYFGKEWYSPDKPGRTEGNGPIMAARSSDDGMTWTELGAVPVSETCCDGNFHEPHVVELPSGKLIGLIRYEHCDDFNSHIAFSLFQSESEDGGNTWTEARPLDIYGAPPHVIRHSSGALVCVYGHRKDPYGERAMISRDEGKTWDSNWILSDGPAKDLGYPASVELPDGRIMTVYYQYADENDKNTSVLYTIWDLPE